MEFNRISIVFCACLLVSSGSAMADPTPDEIADNVFLGQAYPSGNVYLKSFSRSPSWPETVSYHPLVSTKPYPVKVRVGSFSSEMSDETEEIDGRTYGKPFDIPFLESMTDWDLVSSTYGGDLCHKNRPKLKNPSYRYIGGDFFDQMANNCDTNEGTAIYKNNESSIYSFSVVAFHPEIPLSEMKLLGRKSRRLTYSETSQVAREKKEQKATKPACSTVPRYLDSAKSLLSAKVKGTNMSIRISSFTSPGCYGHPAEIFILDVLKSGVQLKQYELVQVKGAL